MSRIIQSSTRWLRRAHAAVLLAVTALPLLIPRIANAHPVHSTLAVMQPDATGVTIRLRAFADDFSAAVARFAGKRPPVDSSASAADIARYAAARFGVTTAAGKSVPITVCGIERARELYWICLRVESGNGASGLSVRNLVLTELHADQVNVVQVKRGTTNRTMLFTRGSKAVAIEHQELRR